LEHNAERANPSVINRIEFQEEHALRGEMRFAQLYVVDPDAQSPILLSGAKALTRDFYDHGDAAFMPDGQSVVYVSKKPADQHPDRVLGTDVYPVNLDGSNDHVLVKIDGWSFSSPKPSRDGTVVAFTAQRMDEPSFRQSQLGITSIKGDVASEPVWLTEESTFLASVGSFEWMQTTPALVFNAGMRGGVPLMTVSPGLIQPAMLVSESDGRPVGVGDFAIGGGELVYSVTSINNPCVLKVKDARGERTIYDLNPWVKSKTLSTPTQATLTRPDGTKVDYWIMEPTNRESGKKYPLALEMHGGPSAMWGPGEFTMWHEFQLLCSWGYGVVYCNPRGSGGYGYGFQKANFQDWGEGPGGDVLAAVDEAVQKDWVDRDKLVITGGSYAGYLTVWVIEHDNRFKAAVAQRGVYDFSTFYGEGNAWRLVQDAMGGPPFDPRVKGVLERNNPFDYVTHIKTPLLIKHGSNDLRTGVSQSEMLYRALKDLNKPVEYLRYPDAGHDLSRNGDPLQRMDRLDRIIEFFERYIENPRPAPIVSAGS
jgi:dipeptidyl aminopeptidase/acylaminoacyl peptidase